MQLEYHCPRRNRFAPNLLSATLEAGCSKQGHLQEPQAK